MRAILASLTIILFAGQAYAIDDEARCTALGSACVCNATMDTNSLDSYQLREEEPDRYAVRPTVPEPNACAPYWGFDLGLTAITPATDGQLPAGNSLSYVWSTNYNSGTSFLGHDGAFGAGDARVCMRWYQRFDGYNYCGGDPGGHKAARLPYDNVSGGSGYATFLQMDGTPPWQLENNDNPTTCCAEGDGGYVGSGSNDSIDIPGDITAADCENGWCYIEMCASDGAGDLFTMVDYDIHIKIRALDSPFNVSELDATAITDGNSGNLGSAEVEMFTQGTCTGTRNFSHFMIAKWATDADQWIGAAVEVEGGAATPSVSGAAITGGSIQ